MKLSPRVKAASVDLSGVGNPAHLASEQPTKRHTLGTAPGQAMQNIILREDLAQWDGASPVRKLDPRTIVRSKWANRHEKSFSDKEFEQLKADIESAGGNVQPIKVRRLKGQDDQYEIVFGHRRHQACFELGLSVLAMIGEVSEQELFSEMDRENRQRKDLRPYEQGVMYKRALDEGLFPSARKLAEYAGADLPSLGRALSIARLPTEVLNAFESPLDIQLRWATDLTQALQKEPEIVILTAKRIQKEVPRLAAKKVLDQLTKGGLAEPTPPSKKISIKGKAGQTGSISLDAKDRSAVVNLKNIDPSRFKELEKIVKSFMDQDVE